MKDLQAMDTNFLEEIEVIDQVYTYTFQVDLTQEITEMKVATTLLMLEQNNGIMDELLETGAKMLTGNGIIQMANKLRLSLLEAENNKALN